MNFCLISVEYLHFDVQVTGLNTHTAPTTHLENGHKSSHGDFGNSLRISVFAIKFLPVQLVLLALLVMKFSIKKIFSKRDQIHSFLQIWSHITEEILNGKLHFFVQYIKQRGVFRILSSI